MIANLIVSTVLMLVFLVLMNMNVRKPEVFLNATFTTLGVGAVILGATVCYHFVAILFAVA